MSKPTDIVETHNVTLQVNKYAMSWLEAESRIGSFARDRLGYRELTQPGIDGRLREFTTQLLENKIVEDSYPTRYIYKTPKTWWQHFKLDKTPRWFKKRYPVQYESKTVKRTVTITRKATYPMADIVLPKHMGQVVIRDVVSPIDLNFYEDDL